VRGRGRLLVPAPGNGPLWARYYEIGTDRPIFGDRDRTIHDDVSEISLERRNGYGWYRDTPNRLLEHYARWSQSHPQ
jgi:PelA/Pel-15E family pectate lyase